MNSEMAYSRRMVAISLFWNTKMVAVMSCENALYRNSIADADLQDMNICKNLRTVPTNSKVFLRGLLTMREKQILTSVIEIQKENWG